MKRCKAAWVLLVVLTLIVMVGCGGSKEPPADSQESTRAQTSQEDTVSKTEVLEQTKDDQTEVIPIAGTAKAALSTPGNHSEEATSSSGTSQAEPQKAATAAFQLKDVPPYDGQAYVALNGNVPYFSTSNLSSKSYESYSPLDSLGRCGIAAACVGQDIMPTEKRGSIGQVKPSGWHTVKYDCVDGKYLYNRCHLIGYQLSAENANTSNLITGTRYLNIEGMLPFENMTADYVKETGNHVEYHVTPVFDGDNLVATGVLMEGYSVEDQGDGVCFCVFAYNVQPGVDIEYSTGDSSLAETAQKSASEKPAGSPAPSSSAAPATETAGNQTPESVPQGNTYILNTNTKKFHYPNCSSVKQMKESNKQVYTGSREDIINQGYEPCKRCNP